MKKKLVLLLVSYVVFCFCIYQNNNIKSTTIKTDNIERVTNTASIKTNEVNDNLFDKKLMLNSAFNESNVVLEVKYDGFLLSYIKDAINSINRSQTQVSKYCLARKIEKYYIYT